MKNIIKDLVLLIAVMLLFSIAQAQTTCTATGQSGLCPPFQATSGFIITITGQVSLSPTEVTTLQNAISYAQSMTAALVNLQTVATAAQAASVATQQKIATAHGWTTSTAFQINLDAATTLAYKPSVVVPPAALWTTVATEGNTVILPAGTIVRLGDPAGTKFGADHSGAALPADIWSANIAIKTTTTIVLSAAALGIGDPVSGYVKVLQVIATGVPQTITVNGVAKTIPAQLSLGRPTRK